MTGTKRSRGKKSENSGKCTTVNLKNEEKVKSLKKKKTIEENYGKSVLTQYRKTFNKEPFMSSREKKTTPEAVEVILIHMNQKKMSQINREIPRRRKIRN